MAGLVDGTINGYLDVRGAILRVGQLDVVGISGVDMATNVLKQDSVLIWDDQGTDLNNPPFTLRGGATRDTTNGYHVLTGNAGGRITRGIKLPNAWMMDFDLYASTSGGTVKIHTYTTSESTYDGLTGYELEFAPSAGTVTLKYRGTQVHQATSVTYATNTFQHYVIGFERGAWTVSIDGTVVFLKDDDERADVYDNTAGQYFRIDASASATHEIRMRKFRLASNGFWLKERNGNLSYETGNVSVGGRNSTHRFDVRGTANVGALTSTTVATSASVEATDTATGTVTTHSIGVVSNAHVQNVYASNCIVDASLNVFSTANVGALTATSVDASDATAATSVSTGAIVVSGTDGGLGVASNIHATNVFAASHLGIATSDTDYNLDVRGTANVGVLSATLPLATVASNLVTYDTATGQLLDSNGLVSNKLAIVSELPPSALTASGVNNIDKHGNFKVSSSAGATDYKAFNKSTATASDAWSSATSVYGGTDNAYNGTASINSISGEWLRLDLPHATTLRYVTMTPTNDGTDGVAQFPEDFQLLGSSDDGASWTSLKSVTGQTASSVTDTKTIRVNASARYRSYAVVVTKTGSSSSLTSIGELKLFAESFSVDEGVVEFPGGLEKGFMEHPVAPMTDYITRSDLGTYEASASSYDSGNSLYPWEAFDRDTVTRWAINTPGNQYNQTTGEWDTTSISTEPNIYTADVGGTRYNGHWLQLKVPHPIVLSHSNIFPTSGLVYRAPVDGVILGSNDGEAWYKLTEFSGKTYSASTWTRIDVNATTPYQYFRLCITKIGTGALQLGYTELTEWRLFAEKPVTKLENVHIAGDLSSETLQTGYIKWPRVPLLADSYKGYELSSSTNLNVGLSNEYFPWHAFNELPNYESNWTPSWASGTSTFTSGAANTSRTTGEDTFNHEWVQIKFPQAIRVSYVRMKGTTGSHSGGYTPKSGRVYASGDGVTWTKVSTYSGLSYASGDDYATVKLESAASYDYWRVCFTEITGSSTIVQVGEIRFFEAATGVGAPPTSAKLQVHGSLGLAKGSSLFAGDSVVAEFPEHDRPLVKYPEVLSAAVADGTAFGGYTATRSSNPGGAQYHVASAAYDGNDVSTWATDYNYNTTTGAAGSSTTFEGENGDWNKLVMPTAIRLKHIYLKNTNNSQYSNGPRDIKLYGSNDGSTWTLIKTATDLPLANASDFTTVDINATQYFNQYVFQMTKVYINSASAAYGRVGTLEYWGYEEGDESVDIVHRSAPNKPGTQQLEVYWDANDSASYSLADNDAIYDLSGNGVNATISGAKGFNAKYNSWILNNNNVDYIYGTLTHGTGAWAHSVSTWVYRYPTSSTTQQHVFQFGSTSTNAGSAARFQYISSQWMIRYYFYSNDVIFYLPEIGKSFGNWLHITATYDGGSDSGVVNGSYGLARKLYVNGVPCEVQSSSSAGSLALATTSSTFYLGHRSGAGSLIGETANARVFSKALSADQVKELYDYEAARFGIREDLVSVHKGNLGIGLRDPEQKLVVAGSLQEFPPAAGMTAEYTQFTGYGVFRASASSSHDVNHRPWEAFGENSTTTESVWNTPGSLYNTTTGNYTGSVSTAGFSGEWIQLEIPHKVKVSRFILDSYADAVSNRQPRDFALLGSNDGSTWETLTVVSGQTSGYSIASPYDASPGGPQHTVNATGYYKFLRTVVMSAQAGTDGLTGIGRLRFFGVPQMDVDDGRQLNVGQVMTSSVGIGTSAPHAPLTVYNDAFGSNHAVTSGTKAYFRYNVNFAYNQTGQHSGGLGIYALKGIMSGQYVISHSGTLQASDARIKENIADVNDSSALETFRLLQPKLYNYKDVVDRGSLPVWGFIAQDVAGTLNYSTDARTDWVPNIYELANVHADGTVLEFDTTKLETGASKLRLYDQSNSEEDVLIDEIIDEFTVRLSKSVGNADQVFVYGQEVTDFHFLKKDAIWTTAAAALQQVDRELQAEKAKVKALESKLAGERVPLENAEGLAVDANYAPCVTANDPLFLGIVGADGRVAAKGKRAKVWVTNIGAPLSAGDIIATTSNVAGYCSKITDLTEVHRAVGKVLVNVALPQVTDHNFVAPTVPRRRKVTETSNVTVWVREFKSTAEQYATLGEDERRVRDEVYYARDDVVEIVHNEYVDKMPAYDVECYHRTQVDTCDAEIYEALPDSEKVNYVLGEDGVYTYTHVNMITIDAWNALEDDERESFVHGYFKNVTEEMSEDEWEALEDSAVQARYERRTRPVYFRLIVARESRHGYTEEVRAETVDVLDAFGRPTYENITGETDPAFEFRYLTAEGEITDRHSGVHMAALVECMLF